MLISVPTDTRKGVSKWHQSLASATGLGGWHFFCEANECQQKAHITQMVALPMGNRNRGTYIMVLDSLTTYPKCNNSTLNCRNFRYRVTTLLSCPSANAAVLMLASHSLAMDAKRIVGNVPATNWMKRFASTSCRLF